MPSRQAIIPGISGSGTLLKSFRSEMREDKVLKDNSSTSSGIHSNSDVSDQGELKRKKKVEFAVTNQIGTRDEMGRQGKSYYYGDKKFESEDASSSSGPDDDGEDEDASDDNDDLGDEENEEFEESSESESDDDDEYTDNRDARETDDRIAWETHRREYGMKSELPNRYHRELNSQNGERRAGLPVNGRVGGSSSQKKAPSSGSGYVRLVKETEEEIELIRRKTGGLRGQPRDPTKSVDSQNDITTKRKSTNAITFTYGRRKEPTGSKSTDLRRNSANTEMLRQMRLRAKTVNTRSQEIDEQHRRIQARERYVIDRTAYLQANGTTNSGQIVQTGENQRPTTKPRALLRSNSDDSVIEFPLKNFASGQSDQQIPIRKAKTLEKVAKQKTKALKNDLGMAKLDVAEAKLGEFSITLRARQARIEERHAKLCRRRAALLKAEEELNSLESKMDDEEEEHRARERRIKNRERRVRQEEAGIRLKEESLRKRESNITEGIEKIEQRRKLVEEKEEVQKAMDEIMTKKEEIHGKSTGFQSVKSGKGGILGKLKRKNSGKDHYSQRNSTTSSSGHSKTSGGKYTSSGSSLSNSETLEPAKPASLGNTTNQDTKPNEKTRNNGKSGVMGLWI